MNLLLAAALCLASSDAGDRPCVVVAVGAPGEAEYESQFREWADRWQAAAERGGADFVRIGGPEGEAETPDARERLRAVLEANAGGTSPLWLVLIGHGTFDGREAKFN